jgi:phosphonatase-like hydrolase
MPVPKLVVCDMAGTTVLDRGEVPSAFTAALAEHGISVTPLQLNAVRGASKRQAIRDLIPSGVSRDSQAELAYSSFKKHLAHRFGEGIQSVPGAEKTFTWLRERGARVALNTGFDREITDLLLTALRWQSGVVHAVVCGDEVPRGRPAPDLIFACMRATGINDAQTVAVLGDTTLDLQAGQNAAVAWNIGVLSGAHSREQLQSQPHTHLLPSIADLPSILTD